MDETPLRESPNARLRQMHPLHHRLRQTALVGEEEWLHSDCFAPPPTQHSTMPRGTSSGKSPGRISSSPSMWITAWELLLNSQPMGITVESVGINY